MSRGFYEADHDAFRDLARTFVERHVAPHLERWDRERLVDRDAWRAAGELGLLGLRTPDRYGGSGVADYRFRCVLTEELSRVGAAAFASGLAINEDVVAGYLTALGSDEQKQRWLPDMAAGNVVASIAMSEPGAGSDLRGISTTARREGDSWVVNGAKTFITNGSSSDVVLVAARTGEFEGRPRFTLILVPADTPGLTRGHKLRKLGLHAQDTAELFFDDVTVPLDHTVGEPGRGFHHLTAQLPLERLSIAWRGLAAAEAALAWTLRYVRTRTAFGQRIIDFQHTRFRLAELVTEVEVTRAYAESLVLSLNDGHLDATTAAKAKWWATELQQRVVTACLQMHGGYGYMEEYPIARAFADGRVQTIVGGTTEIMKEIIGRELAS
ncbi:acyl-CoA dehydrogenase family protein [Phytohabitans suffuscus]|uniref:Acyl-CoA dehydrogenase n=1 Tax=Phytohabitans suffuscus TaxID=624315 RepID=A0A6F8YCC5_9ACTN|nr:acyl-CoA dehydrogenase family protein [Phytohabitans suffuscus]BCB83784.1 acyl-CoA dehydrogenase [Phytohabitans suffuscus]